LAAVAVADHRHRHPRHRRRRGSRQQPAQRPAGPHRLRKNRCAARLPRLCRGLLFPSTAPRNGWL